MIRKYPYGITQKCGNCGKTFTCAGTGWKLITKNNVLLCPYANTGCNCGECNPKREKGCEMIDPINEPEVVCFT